MIFNKNLALQTAKQLLQINAIKLNLENPFTWASGWKSPIYCDNRIILSYPKIRSHLSDIISKKISTNVPNEGYLFDGFPRTIPQAVGFDTLLTKIGQSLNAAINLTADEDELIKRILERGKMSGRSDEAVDIVKKRQKIYWEQTAPLIKYYQNKNILKNIDGIGKIEKITKRILKVIH